MLSMLYVLGFIIVISGLILLISGLFEETSKYEKVDEIYEFETPKFENKESLEDDVKKNKSKVDFGGVVMIGPIPIVFGNNSRAVIFAIILVIILMVLTFVMLSFSNLGLYR